MEENKELETVTESQRNAGKGLFLSGIIVGFAATLLVVGGIFIAFQIHRIVTVKDDVSAQVSYDEGSAVNAQTIKKLQLLEDTVKENFYLSEVTNEQLEDGMYRGLMEALDDPYSEYYTAEELNELTEQTQGIYYGIGAYVSMDSDTNLPKISGVIEGAPAADVDLRANDIIYEVDGVSTAGKTLTESVSMIRGEAGTTVDLTIVRQGAGDYLHVTVERAKEESPTVKYEMLDDNMAYIQIVEFDDVTIDQFTDALATVKGSDMKGLILDLRGNPGGSLDAVVQIARKLLPEGMIVYTEDKAGKRTEYTCDGKTPLEVPLVVLVDMNSASASEILAGAIQDYGIGTLVGTTTFGKGIVQQIMPFTDGSAIKITISAYYTPNGRNIHGTGIEPDVECEFDGDAYYNSDTPVDNQLEKAKEVLKDLMK